MKMLIDRFLKDVTLLPEQKKMLVSIGYTHYIVEKHFEAIFNKYSLSTGQYNLLRVLYDKYPQPCKVNELMQLIIHARTDVSRMVERLRKMGLVERCIRDDDRRAVSIIISQKGLDVLESIIKDEEANMFGPFSQFTDEEAKLMNDMLQKVLVNVAAVNPIGQPLRKRIRISKVA